MKTKRFFLQENELPTQWYNIQADMINKPMPLLNPATREPLKPEDLYPIFAEELCRQELDQTHRYIDIPEPVQEMYRYYRSTPLVRAYGLEKALDTPAHIYFKNESVSPVGSHKLNSAIAQAYYCKQEGVTNVTTETGAGQWGTALSYAAKVFGLEAAVYQVKISYEQKPYRRSMMQVFVSQLMKDGYMEAVDIEQLDSFKAGCLFAKAEGIIPAPESCHAIAATVNEALKCKEAGESKVILFNLSGHGLMDMSAYDQYLAGNLANYSYNG